MASNISWFMWWRMPWFKEIIFFNGHQPCLSIDYGPNYVIWNSLKSSYSTCFRKGLLCNTFLEKSYCITWFDVTTIKSVAPSKYELQHGPFLRDLHFSRFRWRWRSSSFFFLMILSIFVRSSHWIWIHFSINSPIYWLSL